MSVPATPLLNTIEVVDSTTIAITFTLGDNNGSALTDIQYVYDNNGLWTSLGLTTPLEGQTSAIITGFNHPITGIYRIRTKNDIGFSNQSGSRTISNSIPYAPLLTSQPLVVDKTSITFNYSLVYNGSLLLNGIEYARESEGAYTNWFALPFASPLEEQTTSTITGLTSTLAGSYKLRYRNSLGYSPESAAGVIEITAPYAPAFTSTPVVIDQSTVAINFAACSYNGSSVLTDIQYAREDINGLYATWISLGLTSPLEEKTSATITGLTSPVAGSYKLRYVNTINPSPASAAGVIAVSAPYAPVFSPFPTLINSTSFSIQFTLGYNGSSALTDIQYAREEDGYMEWKSLTGLTTPLGDNTSGIISGLTAPINGFYKIRAVNILGPSAHSNDVSVDFYVPLAPAISETTVINQSTITITFYPNFNGGTALTDIQYAREVGGMFNTWISVGLPSPAEQEGFLISTISGLTSPLNGLYKIRSVNLVGHSNPSTETTIYVSNPYPPIFTAVPVILDESSVTIEFSIIYNGSLDLTDIQYTRDYDYGSWTSLGLALPLEGQTTATITGLTAPLNGTYHIRAENSNGFSEPVMATIGTVPDAPSFTSQPRIVDSSTVTLEFSLGSDGGSALTAIQYARSTDNYGSWTTLPGLITPLGDNTTATITGLLPSSNGSYKIRSVNNYGNAESDAQVAYTLIDGKYYPKVVFSSDNQYAIARSFNDTGVDEVAVSSNGGLTWTTITPPGGASCYDVAMSIDGSIMYYTSYDAVYQSTTYGDSFSPLPNAPTMVASIACDSTGDKLYCPSDDGNNMHVFTNTDSSFTQTASLGFTPSSMACSASGVYVYLVNGSEVYVSSDSGIVFTLTTTLSEIISYIVCDQSGERVYVSTDYGVLCSLNYGTSFIGTSHPSIACYNIAIDSLGNRLVSLAVDGTVYVSYDAGTTWTVQTILGQSLTFTSGGVSISPDGTRYTSSIGTPGTYIYSEGTPDIAPIWRVINEPYESGSISINNDNIVAIKYDNNLELYAVWYSIDGGVEWNQSNQSESFGNVSRVKASASGEIVLAMMSDSQVPYLSTDYGVSFNITTLSPVTSIPSQLAVINLTGTSMMTVSDDGRVYRSIDSGLTWTNPSQLTDGTYYSMCSSVMMDRIYIGGYSYNTALNSIFVSTDMGMSWTLLVNSPLSASSDVRHIVCDWSGQNIVMTLGEGVYRSNNGGLSWTQLTTPSGADIYEVASNSTGNRIAIYDSNMYVIYISMDAGTTWSILATPGDIYYNGFNDVTISPDGSRAITSGYSVTYFQTLGAEDLPLLPGPPSFTSMPLIVDNTTITIEFAVGYPSTSALMAIEYARDTDGYEQWTPLTGLTMPLEDATSATISGLTPSSVGSYKLRSVNMNGESVASYAAIAYLLNSGEYYPKVLFSSDNQYAIAFKFNEGGIDEAAVSSNSGLTWTTITPPGGISCYDVAMSLDGSIMYYTSYDAVYQSTTYGDSFSPLQNAPTMVASIACDSTGERLYCVSDDDGYMYVSNDAGANFVQKAYLGFTPLSIKCSASGKYVYTFNGNDIHISSDAGLTFTLITLNSAVTDIACNQTGQIVFVSTTGSTDQYDGGVYVSINYGASFVPTTYRDGINMDDVVNVACDSFGNRVVALASDGTMRVSYNAGTTWTVQTILGQSLMFTSGGVSISPDGTRYASSIGAPGTYIKTEGTPDVAQNLTVINNVRYYNGSISTDNQYIVAASYYADWGGQTVVYSGDAGVTWNEVSDFGYVNKVIASASGEIVLALVDGQVPYLSTDYGVNFAITTLVPNGASPSNYAVMNSSGTSMMTVANDGYVYVYNNSNGEWTSPYQFTDASIYSMCSSASMDRVYVLLYSNIDSMYHIYYSTETGEVWTEAGAIPSTSSTEYMACDWSGLKLVLSAFADGVYRSIDGGSSWVHLTVPSGTYMENIVSNSTGNRIVVIDSNNTYLAYVSIDSGATWTTLSSPDTWWDNVEGSMISPDGSFAMTASTTSNTYIQLLGATDLPISINFPDAPTFTSPPTKVDDTTVTIEFTLGSSGDSALTAIKYARSIDNYATWTPLDLQLPLEGQTTATISGLSGSVYGSYKLRAVNSEGSSVASTVGLLAIAPDVPYFSGAPTYVNQNSISINYILGYNGGSDIIDIEYARSPDYDVWTSFDLIAPLEGQSTVTITGLTPPITGYYKLRAVNAIGPSEASIEEFVEGITTVPNAPTFISQPTIVDETTIHAEFSLGYDGGDAVIDVQYARDTDNYQQLISIPGLPSPIEGTISINIADLTPPVTGNYRLYAVNNIGTSEGSADGLVEEVPPVTVPDAPSFTSPPTYLSDTSISIDFTLGANGGSDIIRIEYAREADYNTWTPISGLTSPVTITVGYPSIGNYKLRAVNAIGPSDASAEGLVEAPPVTVPDAPYFTTAPGAINSTSIYIQFETGYNNGSDLTDLQYAREDINGFYTTWISVGLSLPLEGQTDAVINGLTPPINGFYKLRTVNVFGPSAASDAGYVEALPATVPDAPSFTSPPTIVNTTTIHVEYTLGSNGGSALTDLQYAREEEGSYDNWISIPDLPSTIDGTSSINITGLTAPVTGNYKLRAVNNEGPSDASAAGLVEATVPCFLEGSKILCKVDGVEKYVAVETIRPGTLVKTSLHGYQPVKLIGSRVMVNAGGDKRDKNSLYLCTKANYPELTEDLIITGCHAILVDHITDVHRQGIIQTLERVFVTDKKYRLPACVDERAPVYQPTGTFTVWHFALEHTDIKMNYGVYAHGLLVESSPIWHMNTKNYRLVQ